jgi:GNAT superfamily N-acetyltransferase
VRAVELDHVGAAEWDAVLAGEQHAWGVEGEQLSWAEKRRHVAVLDDAGVPLALAGVLVAEVTAGDGEPFEVAGIGSVIVTRTMRGRGLARLVVEAILDIARELGPQHAMLFCREDLVGLYARLGFTIIDAPVTAEQPGGRVVMTMRAMWAPLAAGVSWPAGDVEVLGLPF